MNGAPRQSVSEAQTRVNVDALEQRVYGSERAISDLSSQMSSMRRDMVDAIAAISTKLDTQQRDAAAQQQAAQQATISASRTNWIPIIGTMATLILAFVTIFGVVGSMALSPIRDSIEQDRSSIHDINVAMTPLLAFAAQHDRDMQQFRQLEESEKQLDRDKWSDAAQTEFEKRIDERLDLGRQDQSHKLDAFDDRIKTINTGLVSRSEHESHWAEFTARLNQLSDRLTEVQKEFSGNFTLGDVVKELQRQISELRMSPSPTPATRTNP